MKRKLLGILITLNVLAPFVHADEPFSIPASAVNTQAFDEPDLDPPSPNSFCILS